MPRPPALAHIAEPEVHRKKEERSAKRAVKKQRQKIGTCESAIPEKLQRQHRIASSLFEDDEEDEAASRND